MAMRSLKKTFLKSRLKAKDSSVELVQDERLISMQLLVSSLQDRDVTRQLLKETAIEAHRIQEMQQALRLGYETQPRRKQSHNSESSVSPRGQQARRGSSEEAESSLSPRKYKRSQSFVELGGYIPRTDIDP